MNHREECIDVFRTIRGAPMNADDVDWRFRVHRFELDG